MLIKLNWWLNIRIDNFFTFQVPEPETNLSETVNNGEEKVPDVVKDESKSEESEKEGPTSVVPPPVPPMEEIVLQPPRVPTPKVC